MFSSVETKVMKLKEANIRIDGKHESYNLTPTYRYRKVYQYFVGR